MDYSQLMLMAAGKQVKEPSKDFSHCRLSFIGSRSWDCLWNTAWLGPHGFLGGNNMDEAKEQANKAADCHCYFKWFFEKPAHFETKAEKRDREKREKQERKADVRPALDDIIPGKNLFVHLYFGVMFGWMLSLLYIHLYGGAVPWVRWILGNHPSSW